MFLRVFSAIFAFIGISSALAASPTVALSPQDQSACAAILAKMPPEVQTAGPTLHRYCGNYENGGGHVVIAVSGNAGRYMVYFGSDSAMGTRPLPGTLENGTLTWVVRNIVPENPSYTFTYHLGQDNVLTRDLFTGKHDRIIKTGPMVRM